MTVRLFSLLFLGTLLPATLGADAPKKSARTALQPFSDLIGLWNGTGQPGTSFSSARDDFWLEKIDWSWKFQGEDAWLIATFDKSRHFVSGELRYLPASDGYQFKLKTTDKKDLVYEGTLANRYLNLYRDEPTTRESQRLTFQLLHHNRIVYRYSVRPAGKTLYKQLYQVGATKAGVPFASGNTQPECIVSGGLGSMTVSYQGKTYYVCCSGCRDEFRANPEMYVREYEARKKAKK